MRDSRIAEALAGLLVLLLAAAANADEYFFVTLPNKQGVFFNNTTGKLLAEFTAADTIKVRDFSGQLPDEPTDPTPDPDDKFGLIALAEQQARAAGDPANVQKVRLIYFAMAQLVESGTVTQSDLKSRLDGTWQVMLNTTDLAKWQRFRDQTAARFNTQVQSIADAVQGLKDIATGVQRVEGAALDEADLMAGIVSNGLERAKSDTTFIELLQFFFEFIWPIIQSWINRS